MHKKKKVKTIIVEKYKYDHDDDYGVTLAPELLLKLLEFARTESTSDEQLHSIVTRAHIMSHREDNCLYMEHYPELVTDTVPVVVEVPVEEVATLPVE
jgi:hypothetical protein